MKENVVELDNLLWDEDKQIDEFEIVRFPEEDKDSDDEDDIKINEKKRKKWIGISKTKDYLMMIFLLLCSSVNFSILYIPCTILGISYILLLLKFNNHMYQIKKKIEIISLVYSSLLIITKSVFIGMIQNDYINYNSYSFTFNNLGIRHQNENLDARDIMLSIIGEIFLLIISIISLIISFLCKEIDFEIKTNNTQNIDIFNKKIKTIIYLGYISILINAIYNKSYITDVVNPLTNEQFDMSMEFCIVKKDGIYEYELNDGTNCANTNIIENKLPEKDYNGYLYEESFDIDFSDLEGLEYYIKSTVSASSNLNIRFECGSGSKPTSCRTYDSTKTLEAEEIDKVINQILNRLDRELNAKLR